MQKYIIMERNGIHIIDLAKTQIGLQKATDKIREVLKSGKHIIFVGTKKSVSYCVKLEAERSKMNYVANRWLGGMLTNFTTIRQSIKKLEDYEKMETDGLFKELTKKEIITINKKRAKLNAVLGGIRDMKFLPGLVFVVDTKHEHIAVKEAKRLNIPVVGIVDTNCNPDPIDFPIPGNDDAIKSVTLITKTIADAIVDATAAAQHEQDTQIIPEVSKAGISEDNKEMETVTEQKEEK